MGRILERLNLCVRIKARCEGLPRLRPRVGQLGPGLLGNSGHPRKATNSASASKSLSNNALNFQKMSRPESELFIVDYGRWIHWYGEPADGKKAIGYGN